MDIEPSEWAETYGLYHTDKQTLVLPEETPILRALFGEEIDEMEFFIRNEKKPQGTYISATARALRDHQNQEIVASLGIVRDVTQSKEAELQLEQTVKELRDQTQLMETVFQNMKEGMAIADPTGRLILMNASGEKIMGMGVIPVQPSEWTETYGVFHPDQKTPFPFDQTPMFRALQGETVEDVELFVRNANKPDGAFASTTAQPILDPASGELKAAVAIFRDVTEEKKLEDKLRSQAQLMETVFNSVSEGVVVTDAKGNFLFSNSSAHDIVGMGEEEGSPDEWSETYGTFYLDGKTPLPVPGPSTHARHARRVCGRCRIVHTQCESALRGLHQRQRQTPAE